MKENNVENFINQLKNYHTSLATFIKLYNNWVDLTVDERKSIIAQCYDKN